MIITNVSISDYGDLTEFITYRSMWDTGAVKTFISMKVVNDLRLKKYGSGTIRTATDTKKVDWYLCTLSLEGHKQAISINPPTFQEHEDYDVIIGLDIIEIGKFIYENKEFSFIAKSLL